MGSSRALAAFLLVCGSVRTMIDGRSCSIVAERGVGDLVERTIDMSCSLRTGWGGAVETLADGGGGILAGEEDRAGRCFGGDNG